MAFNALTALPSTGAQILALVEDVASLSSQPRFTAWTEDNTSEYVFVRNFGITAESPSGFEVRLKYLAAGDRTHNPEALDAYDHMRLYMPPPVIYWVREIAHLYDPGQIVSIGQVRALLAKEINGVPPTSTHKRYKPTTSEDIVGAYTVTDV